MCGIVGYIGDRPAPEILISGLETLEYRGYDSAGIATMAQDGEVDLLRSVGRVSNLRAMHEENPLENTIGIGHTRWATHGGITRANTHPHRDADSTFYVAHNGIIENSPEIREFLADHGYPFYSETDTEVIPSLVAHYFKEKGNVEAAFNAALRSIQGSYALALLTTHDKEHLYAARLSSPLAIGVGRSEMLIGSDALPIHPHTKDVVYLEDGEVAILSKDGYRITDSDECPIERDPTRIRIESASTDLGKYPNYMSKEIHEAPIAVRNALLGRLAVEEKLVKLGGLEDVEERLRSIDRIVIIACGTSYYAGLVGEYLLEELAGIPVEVQQASEFLYKDEPLSRNTAVLAISQSGETADTIEALKKLDGRGILKLGIVNSPGSTITRITDAGVLSRSGPEFAVASTKAFMGQTTILSLLALHLSQFNHTQKPNYEQLLQALDEIPQHLERVLEQEDHIKQIAQKYASANSFFYIGRRYAYPVALEGALKLKEISYIHAEGYAGGELKHGPLALIDEHTPTFAIALTNGLERKSASNISEIKSRGGSVIAVVDNPASEAAINADDVILVPEVAEQLQPLVSGLACHLFAYHIALALERDIDKPRNLAKSVTVE
jgi:glucosamine--fructose-6-phosphate aminotransferase (isomerizing)